MVHFPPAAVELSDRYSAEQAGLGATTVRNATVYVKSRAQILARICNELEVELSRRHCTKCYVLKCTCDRFLL